MLSQNTIQLKILQTSLLHLLELLNMALESSVGDFVVEIILEFSKRVFSDFLLGLLVSYTTLVRTVLSLKNTLSP